MPRLPRCDYEGGLSHTRNVGICFVQCWRLYIGHEQYHLRFVASQSRLFSAFDSPNRSRAAGISGTSGGGLSVENETERAFEVTPCCTE